MMTDPYKSLSYHFMNDPVLYFLFRQHFYELLFVCFLLEVDVCVPTPFRLNQSTCTSLCLYMFSSYNPFDAPETVLLHHFIIQYI